MEMSTDLIESRAGACFAERIKGLREEKGLRQGQLAKFLGVARPSLSAYENGTTTPDIFVLDRAAQYFEVSSDYLLGRERGKTAKKSEFIGDSGFSDRATDKLFSLDGQNQITTKISGEARKALHEMNNMEDEMYSFADKLIPSEALSMLLESFDGAEFLQLLTRLLLIPAFTEKDFEQYNHLKPTTDGKSLWRIYRDKIYGLDSTLDAFNCNGDICLELTAVDLLSSAIEKRLREAIEEIRNSEECKKERMKAFLFQHHVCLRELEIDNMLFSTIKLYKEFLSRHYSSDEADNRIKEYVEIHSSTERFAKALEEYCGYSPDEIKGLAEEHRIGHSSLKAYRIMLEIRNYPLEDIDSHVEEHRKYFFSKK